MKAKKKSQFEKKSAKDNAVLAKAQKKRKKKKRSQEAVAEARIEVKVDNMPYPHACHIQYTSHRYFLNTDLL